MMHDGLIVCACLCVRVCVRARARVCVRVAARVCVCRLNRGIGIEVHKDVPAILTFLQGKAAKLSATSTSQPPGHNTWVLQKYIENPVSALPPCPRPCTQPGTLCACVHPSC